jgi:hypothetical protein
MTSRAWSASVLGRVGPIGDIAKSVIFLVQFEHKTIS